MTTFVVDASIAASWILPDEGHALADRLFSRLYEEPASVPDIFWLEMRNLLVIAERRGRIGQGEAGLALRRLRGAPIEGGERTDDGAVVALALRHNLTAYDAAYLVLALRRSLPLASLDKAMIAAARREGVRVLG